MLSAIAVVLILSVPMAYGAVSSAWIGENAVSFESAPNGGISGKGKQSKTSIVDGHPTIRIHYSLNDNFVGVQRESVEVHIPAGISFCVKVETVGRALSGSSLEMSLRGTGYIGTAPENGIHYFSAENSVGNVMTPMTDLGDVVFMSFDTDLIIDCDARRWGVQCPLKFDIVLR